MDATPKAPATGLDPGGQPHDQEARLLVQLLRSSPLSVVYAQGGADKTALLRLGLMPHLARRASDKFVPVAVRPSGVVVPFPDRRGRSSPRATKRKREFIVYFDEWNNAPLDALRAALHVATVTGRAEPPAPSMRLGEVLEEVSRRMDAHLIVLLDRFEELVRPSAETPGRAQFANEFAEAVTRPGLPASFLIAIEEEARPWLASLRARIPGFDDFSLKLAPPRDFKAPATPRIVTSAEEAAKPASPEAIQALPVLTEKLVAPVRADPKPLPAAPAVEAPRPPRGPKVKAPPPPKVPVTLDDVYTMIEDELSRMAATRFSQPPAAPPRSGSSPSPSPTHPDSPAQSSARVLQKAIERMAQRLKLRPEDDNP